MGDRNVKRFYRGPRKTCFHIYYNQSRTSRTLFVSSHRDGCFCCCCCCFWLVFSIRFSFRFFGRLYAYLTCCAVFILRGRIIIFKKKEFEKKKRFTTEATALQVPSGQIRNTSRRSRVRCSYFFGIDRRNLNNKNNNNNKNG